MRNTDFDFSSGKIIYGRNNWCAIGCIQYFDGSKINLIYSFGRKNTFLNGFFSRKSASIVNGWIGFAIAISDFIRSESFLLEPIAVFPQHSVNPMDGNNIRTDERIRRCSTP